MRNLNDGWCLSRVRNYVGVSIVRIMAVALSAKPSMSYVAWKVLRAELVATFNERGLLAVRGNNPRPYSFVGHFLPEWRGFYCHSNCGEVPPKIAAAAAGHAAGASRGAYSR